MAITFAVRISEFEFGNRFDAELYRPSLRESFDSLNRTKYELKRLHSACLIRSGTTPPDRVDGLQKGAILYKTTDIRNAVIPSRGDYYRISYEIHHRMSKTRISEGDVLLNIVGATLDVIGRTGFVASLENEANITQAMVFLRSNSPQLLSGYLFAFLNTRFAQDQIARYARPTGQYNLNLQEVGHILIPILPLAEQAKIEQMILKSSSLLEQAEDSYTQAQQLLESELGLDKLRFDKPMGYTARFRELELLQRADAEFFNPELRYFQQEIAKHNPLRPITDFVSILKFSNPPYADIGLPIITQKHLGKISPDNYGDDLVAHDSWVQANPLASIRNYDLLYYSVGAYLGKTNIWLSNDKAVHASFITMLRPFDSEESGFLHVLLNSEYGILQSKCFQSGTSQPYIYPKDIRRFLIPTVSKSVRCQIHELVIDSFNKGEESKQLLAQAKSRVEQLIEEAVQS